MASNEQYFAAIVLSIIATATFIGGVNLAYNGHFPDLSTPAGTLATSPATIYDTAYAKQYLTSGIFLSGQNFTSSSGFDTNITIIKAGTWTQTAAGYELTADAFLDDPLIVLKNVKPSGNIYTVTYAINNVPNTDFYITPRHLSGASVSDLRIEFKQDGIYIPKYPRPTWPWMGDITSTNYDYFYAIPNAQTTLPGSSEIVTILTDVSNGPGDSVDTAGKNSLLSVSKDGVLLFSVLVRDLVSGATSTDVLTYAGAGSHVPGFIIVSMDAPIQYTPNSVTLIGSKDEAGLIAGAIGVINLISSFFTGVSLFLGSMGTIIGYSISSEICPVWVTAIVMTPQLAGLALIVTKILRGTS